MLQAPALQLGQNDHSLESAGDTLLEASTTEKTPIEAYGTAQDTPQEFHGTAEDTRGNLGNTSVEPPIPLGDISIEPQDIPLEQQAAVESRPPPEVVLEKVKKSLHSYWTASLEDSGLRISLHSRDEARIAQRNLLIGFAGEVRVFVHGQELPSTFKTVSLSCENTTEYAQKVLEIVAGVRLKEICIGVKDSKFKVWWKNYLNTCYIDNNSFHETRYQSTLRSNECEYLVDLPRKTCPKCYKIVKSLMKRPTNTVSTKKTPNKFKPRKFLSSAEKDARDKRKAKQIRNLRRQVARLKGQLDDVISKEGREIDSELSSSLGKELKRGLQDLRNATGGGRPKLGACFDF